MIVTAMLANAPPRAPAIIAIATIEVSPVSSATTKTQARACAAAVRLRGKDGVDREDDEP